MTANPGIDSLYSANAEPDPPDPGPRPDPGTTFTHSFETVDNDRASLLLDAGVVR